MAHFTEPTARDESGHRAYEYYWLKQLPLPLLNGMIYALRGSQGRPFRTVANAANEIARVYLKDQRPAAYLKAKSDYLAFNDPLGDALHTPEPLPLPVSQESPLAPATPSASPISVDLSNYVTKGEFGEAIASTVASVNAAITRGLKETEGAYSAGLDAIRKDCQSAIAECIKAASLPRELHIVHPDSTSTNVGKAHKAFPQLLAMLATGANVWLAGPAGSGKTTAAEQCAKALGVPFYSCGAISYEEKLTGFQTANGTTIRTEFREAWEHGGVFLWDEIDGSDSNAVLPFNAALSAGYHPFPDAKIRRHKDCYIIAAANTWGHGGTFEYVGRLKQDAAFMDRFVTLFWEYDSVIEDQAGNPEWIAIVRSYRAKVQAKGIKVMITPRASFYGARLLAAGMDQDSVIAATIRKGMTNEQWSAINV